MGEEDGAYHYPPHATRKIWEELFPVTRCDKGRKSDNAGNIDPRANTYT